MYHYIPWSTIHTFVVKYFSMSNAEFPVFLYEQRCHLRISKAFIFLSIIVLTSMYFWVTCHWIVPFRHVIVACRNYIFIRYQSGRNHSAAFLCYYEHVFLINLKHSIQIRINSFTKGHEVQICYKNINHVVPSKHIFTIFVWKFWNKASPYLENLDMKGIFVVKGRLLYLTRCILLLTSPDFDTEVKYEAERWVWV